MLKKFGVILSGLILIFGIIAVNAQPIFSSYANDYEVYLHSDSSLAQIKRVNKTEYLFLQGVKGESVQIQANDFDLKNFLNDFNAKVQFTEGTNDSQIYYAYSPKLKNIKTVKGKKVNLQVVVAEERVVLGSPLIFGSF